MNDRARAAHDWMRMAPSQPGLDRFEAFFGGHAYDPHRHDTYALGYTTQGVQSFTYRGVHVKSLPGHVMILHPDEPHDGHAGTEVGFVYRMLYLQPRLIRDALGRSAMSLPFVPSPISTDIRLLGAIHLMLNDLDNTLEPLETDYAVLAVAEALLNLAPEHQGRRPAAACAKAVERARQYLDAYFDRIVTSEELETETDLERYELARHFRRLLGTSPYRYLTMRRLDHVRAAIRQGQHLSEAALSAGFADQSHMTRQFKKAYGLSPGYWRRLHFTSR